MTAAARDTWTVKAVLEWTTGHFKRAGLPDPRLEAEILLAHVLGCDRVRLYVDHQRPLSMAERDAYRALVERRAAGEPTAYLLGQREFYGRPFRVDRRVLIPRPETELLVDRALEALAPDATGPVLDLCSGSGCIGVTLCAERPALSVLAVDVSEDAAEVARENARALGVEGRYAQRVGDLFDAVRGEGPWPLVTANPPYVPAGDLPTIQREIRDHEPRVAVVGGEVGDEVAIRVVDAAPDHLLPGGLLLMEHGAPQGAGLRAHAEATGRYAEVSTLKDHAGLDRILVARVP